MSAHANYSFFCSIKTDITFKIGRITRTSVFVLVWWRSWTIDVVPRFTCRFGRHFNQLNFVVCIVIIIDMGNMGFYWIICTLRNHLNKYIPFLGAPMVSPWLCKMASILRNFSGKKFFSKSKIWCIGLNFIAFFVNKKLLMRFLHSRVCQTQQQLKELYNNTMPDNRSLRLQ